MTGCGYIAWHRGWLCNDRNALDLNAVEICVYDIPCQQKHFCTLLIAHGVTRFAVTLLINMLFFISLYFFPAAARNLSEFLPLRTIARIKHSILSSAMIT